MDAGDIATWAGVGVSLVVSGGALAVAVRALKYQRIAAEMQEIAARAAVRQADAAERQIALTWPAMPEPADLVTWSVEHRKGNTYALRNAGTATATAVTVDESRVTSLHRLLPKQATIAPGSSEEFLLIGAFGAPIPREVWVSWDGADRSVAVAVPSKSGS